MPQWVSTLNIGQRQFWRNGQKWSKKKLFSTQNRLFVNLFFQRLHCKIISGTLKGRFNCTTVTKTAREWERERERVGSRVFFPSFVAKVFIAGHNAPVKHMWARRDLLWMERDERGRERETCLKDVALSLSLSLTITHTLSESVFLAQRAHLSVYKLR